MMVSDRINKLFRDTGIFFLGTFASRIIIYILTPLYTSYLGAVDYANADLIHTAIQIMVPLFTLRVASAVFRFCMDPETNVDIWLTNSLVCVAFSCIPAFVLTHILSIFFEIDISWIIVLGCYLSVAISELLGSFAKAVGKNKIFAVNSILNAVSLLGINYLLLVRFSRGVSGYFIALFCASCISCIFYVFQLKIIRHISVKKISRFHLKKMLIYSLPLVPSALSFWIVQASDKYMVYGIVSPALAGLYSVAYKIPNITGALVNVFSQAWEISAINNADNDYYAKVYSVYFKFIIVCTAVVLLLTKPIALLLFKKEFYQANVYVPWLIIAFIFCYLQTFMEGILVSRKETWQIMVSTIFGAITNILLNIILIPAFNVYGAIVATGISYIVMYLIRRISLLKKNVLVYIDKHNVCYFLLLMAEFIFYSFNQKKIYILAPIFCFCIVVIGIDDVLKARRTCKS